MGVSVVCVGKLKERFYEDAAREYVKRLSRIMPVQVIEVADEREPENASKAQQEQVMLREGQRILDRLGKQTHVIALCVEAREKSSEELAQRLGTLFVDGKSDVAFVIGGSLGLSGEVLARADEKISMSRMTFPHQLVRVMLLEQLFRAAKINAGERYHK